MKHLLILLLGLVCLSSCDSTKNGSASKTLSLKDLPEVYTDYNVPFYANAKKDNTTYKEEGRKMEWITNFSTEDSFDDIYKFYMDKFKEEKWLFKKNRRSDQGLDTESILLITTKGVTKHTLFVSKGTIRTQKVKSTVSRISI